jgi:hypothetical protein
MDRTCGKDEMYTEVGQKTKKDKITSGLSTDEGIILKYM